MLESGKVLIHSSLATTLSSRFQILSSGNLPLHHVYLEPIKPKSSKLQSIRQSKKGNLLAILWELPPFFSSGPTMQLKSPVTHQGDEMLADQSLKLSHKSFLR